MTHQDAISILKNASFGGAVVLAAAMEIARLRDEDPAEAQRRIDQYKDDRTMTPEALQVFGLAIVAFYVAGPPPRDSEL